VEQSASGALWLDGERFLAALVATPERVRSVLADAGGLLPELADKTQRSLAGEADGSGGVSGLGGLLAPAQTALAADPVLRVFAARRADEAELSRGLLDLYDETSAEKNSESEKNLEQPGWTGVLRLKG
jgi:hypothetical protein